MSCDTAPKFVFLFVSCLDQRTNGKSITHSEFQRLIQDCSVLILDFCHALDFDKEIKTIIINGVYYYVDDYDELDETSSCSKDCLCKIFKNDYVDYSNLDNVAIFLRSMSKLETVYVNPSQMYFNFPGTIENYIPFWSDSDHKLDVHICNLNTVDVKPLVNGNLNDINSEQYLNVLKKMLQNQFENFKTINACFH